MTWYEHRMHTGGGQTQARVTDSKQNPFGEPGRDYSPEYRVTTRRLRYADKVTTERRGSKPLGAREARQTRGQ